MADTEPSRRGHSERVVAGVLGGFIAFGGAGLIDGLVSWNEAAQFLPGFGERLGFLGHQVASSGLLGALLGGGFAALAALLSRTRLGDLFAAITDPQQRAASISLLLVTPPTFFLVGNAAFGLAVANLAARRHPGLQLGSAMLIGVAALVLAGVLSFVVALPVERLLSALARRSRLVDRAIRARLALPGLVVLAAMVVGAAVVAAMWDTLALLPLRGLWVVVGSLVLAFPGAAAGRVYARRLWRAHRAIRAFVVVLLVVGSVTGALASGTPSGIRQAVTTYTGLGGALLSAYRKLVDLDRDGYSPILGGGDCDDFDRTAHPGGTEIPGDGVDQNCIGGDAVVDRDPDDVRFTSVPAAVPDDANVVLITIDTVRADHFGMYGYDRDTTPNLDALAAEGVVFDNAWAHAPSTRYSMPAILTGRYPLNVHYDHSVRPWPGLDREATTIAEILSRRGFETGAITNHWYFAPQRRMNQGFDTYENANSRLHRQDPQRGPASSSGSSSEEQTDAAIAFLERNASRRFFLWVHYYDPHHEYESHEEVRSFGDSDMDLYDEEILFTDHHVGRLLDDLRERGVYDESIIVVTGDHGEGFGEHGVDFHGFHLYAAQTKVPMFMKIPGVEPRRVVTAAGHVDIVPTLTNLVGGRATEEMMGRSLLGLIIGEEEEDLGRYVFQQVSWGRTNDIRGAASARCHVIHNVRPHSSWELYRVDRDPNETRNLIGESEVCADAKPTLEEFLDWSDLPPEGAATQRILTTAPEIEGAVDVDVGDELRLVGVELPDGPVRRGRSFQITWTWYVREPMSSGWRVFAHIRGSRSGRFLADHDPPRPFETWPEERWVQYETTVNVPYSGPPGEYTINFGVYRGRTRKSLSSDTVPVTEQNEAVVGTVTVR